MITDGILAIFVLTYVGMAIGRIPGLRTDRAGLALVAAVLMIVATGATIERRAGLSFGAGEGRLGGTLRHIRRVVPGAECRQLAGVDRYAARSPSDQTPLIARGS
jgi:hypothetical protein